MVQTDSSPPARPDRRRFFLIVLVILLLLLLLLLIWFLFFRPQPSDLTAIPGGPYIGNEMEPITFDGSGSTGTGITSYTWDFGDGSGPANGVSTTHVYTDGLKQFTATLTVTDDRGRSASQTTRVTISNLPPTADAGGPYTCSVGQTIQLLGSCDDPSPADKTSLTCVWSDLGGSVINQANYTCPASAGKVTVTLTATDKDGASAQDSATIQVRSIGADANGPYDGLVNLPVSFDGSGSFPVESIESYNWDFGDGQTGEGVNPQHTYTQTGLYNVILTVAGNGQTISDTTTATITATGQQPVAIIRVPVFACSKGPCARLDGSASVAAVGHQLVAYEWDFGDGTSGTGNVVEHTYPAPGHYIITLTVTDETGAKDASTIELIL